MVFNTSFLSFSLIKHNSYVSQSFPFCTTFNLTFSHSFLVAKLLYNSKCPSVCYKQYGEKVIFSAAFQESWLFFLIIFVWSIGMGSYSIIILSVCLFVMPWIVFEFPYSWFFVFFIKSLFFLYWAYISQSLAGHLWTFSSMLLRHQIPWENAPCPKLYPIFNYTPNQYLIHLWSFCHLTLITQRMRLREKGFIIKVSIFNRIMLLNANICIFRVARIVL